MLYENILNEIDLKSITTAAIYETTNFPCLLVPKHQSFPTMHRKYKHYIFWQNFQNKLLKIAKQIDDKEYRIDSCWFNACTADSNFDWHAHYGYDLTCVFYVYNCNNNGTLIKQRDQIIQPVVKDNSLSFMKSGVEHRVPEWNGNDRYSIAIQLIIK